MPLCSVRRRGVVVGAANGTAQTAFIGFSVSGPLFCMDTKLKIVLTGASGYVGRNIVPLLLQDATTSLLLVGRDTQKLNDLFPQVPACTLEDIEAEGQGFDCLVHLAVLNTDADSDAATFRSVNVDLTQQVAEIAARAGIARFLNISSVHVLDEANSTPYATSKRDAITMLKGITGTDVTNVFLPFVRGAQWNGKLSFLNTLPAVFAKPMSAFLLALKPSVTAETIAQFILADQPARDRVILSEDQLQNPVYRTLKRILDLTFAITIIVLLWWALLIVWVAIKMGSPGPGIFTQERVGRHGKLFTCYKFRTMKEGAVQAGTHEVTASSITGIGRVLRGTKVDELPQVVNIFMNEISLIGPRPGLPVQAELAEQRRENGVFSVKPGISGLAQVNDVDMSDPAKLVQWDTRYIALQSVLLDLKIVLSTVTGGGQGDRIGK